MTTLCMDCGDYDLVFVPACGDPAVGEAKVLLYSGDELRELTREIAFMDAQFGAIKQAQNANDAEAVIAAKEALASLLSDYIDPTANLPTKHMVQAYSISGRRWTRIRSDKMRNHWRSYDLPPSLLEANTSGARSELDTAGLRSAFGRIKDQLARDFSSGIGMNGQILQGNVEGSITDLWDARWLEWVDAVNDSFVYSDAGTHHDLSAGAQLLRGYAGFNINIGNNPETGGFGLAASGNASAILAEARANLSGYLPHRDGWHFFMEYADPQASQAGQQSTLDFGYFRGRLTIKVRGMLGASVMGTLGIQYVPDGSSGSHVLPAAMGSYGGASVAAFAGVEAGGTVEGAIEWRKPALVERLANGSTREIEPEGQWGAFFQIGAGLAANAGAGGELTLMITYENGKFMIRAAAQLVIGIGAKGEIGGVVGLGTIVDFIMYVYDQLKENDFSYLDFMDESAFHALVGITLFVIEHGVNAIVAIGSLADSAIDAIMSPFNAASDAEAYARKIKARPSALIFASPEAKGAILYKLSETYTFSWEEHQEAAILTVLGTMQTQREWAQVIERVSPGGRRVGRAAGMRRLNWIMDGGSQARFDTLVYFLDRLPPARMYAGEPISYSNLA